MSCALKNLEGHDLNEGTVERLRGLMLRWQAEASNDVLGIETICRRYLRNAGYMYANKVCVVSAMHSCEPLLMGC